MSLHPSSSPRPAGDALDSLQELENQKAVLEDELAVMEARTRPRVETALAIRPRPAQLFRIRRGSALADADSVSSGRAPFEPCSLISLSPAFGGLGSAGAPREGSGRRPLRGGRAARQPEGQPGGAADPRRRGQGAPGAFRAAPSSPARGLQ